MEISLNACEWSVRGLWPHTYFAKPETGFVTDCIPATIPGGVHKDLLQAGLIADPYFENNSLLCEWIENKWWLYKTMFHVPSDLSNHTLQLVFKGIDYHAHFFLNGVKLGTHTGMYTPATFDVTDLVQIGLENCLEVLFESAPKEQDQMGYTCQTHTQKSRFNYKWDFSTRLVNIGIWDDVVLHVSKNAAIQEHRIVATPSGTTGTIELTTEIVAKKADHYSHHYTVFFGEQVVATAESTAFLTQGSHTLSVHIPVQDVQLWYPNGMGPQPLYRVDMTVSVDGVISDALQTTTAFRTLEYQQNPNSDCPYPYLLYINQKPVYICGVNITPFDHLYGNVTKDTYQKYVALLKNGNINLVRIWGGGIIEKDYFYSLCDENGILIWQEFIQSSSATNSTSSQIPEFVELLRETAVHAIKTRRNHVSLVIWAGGNELLDEDNRLPADNQFPTLALLNELVNTYDPARIFMPTSPTGPNFSLNTADPGHNYDIHGDWHYGGMEKHYEIYNASDSVLQSEFGCPALSQMTTLSRFLSPENLTVNPMRENCMQRHHGDWWCCYDRDTEIYGSMNSLEKLVKSSQITQAESIRYTVESNRRRQYHNSGSIVWQFNEPWPNFSCTSLVDYYRFPKMAYYWLKNSFENLHPSMRYERLFCLPDEIFSATLYLHASLDNVTVSYTYELLDCYGNVHHRAAYTVHPDSTGVKCVGGISETLGTYPHGLFFVRLRAQSQHGIHENVYVFGQNSTAPLQGLFAEPVMLSVKKVNQTLCVCNTGDMVAFGVYPYQGEKKNPTLVKDAYVVLFPQETTFFTFVSQESTAEVDCMTADALNRLS